MKLKKCGKCKKQKSLRGFNKNCTKSDGHNSICRICSRKESKKYYKKYKKKNKKAQSKKAKRNKENCKEKMLEYLSSHPCVDCGNKNEIVLEFDHLPQYTKRHNISRMLSTGHSWASIQKEMTKCDVVCANCHRIRTATRGNEYRYVYQQTKKKEK